MNDSLHRFFVPRALCLFTILMMLPIEVLAISECAEGTYLQAEVVEPLSLGSSSTLASIMTSKNYINSFIRWPGHDYAFFIHAGQSGENIIYQINLSNGDQTLVAGQNKHPPYEGLVDGVGSNAQFDFQQNGHFLALNDDNTVLYAADSNNYKIRKIDITTIPSNVTSMAHTFSSIDTEPMHVLWKNDRLFVQTKNGAIHKCDMTQDTCTLIISVDSLPKIGNQGMRMIPTSGSKVIYTTREKISGEPHTIYVYEIADIVNGNYTFTLKTTLLNWEDSGPPTMIGDSLLVAVWYLNVSPYTNFLNVFDLNDDGNLLISSNLGYASSASLIAWIDGYVYHAAYDDPTYVIKTYVGGNYTPAQCIPTTTTTTPIPNTTTTTPVPTMCEYTGNVTLSGFNNNFDCGGTSCPYVYNFHGAYTGNGYSGPSWGMNYDGNPWTLTWKHNFDGRPFSVDAAPWCITIHQTSSSSANYNGPCFRISNGKWSDYSYANPPSVLNICLETTPELTTTPVPTTTTTTPVPTTTTTTPVPTITTTTPAPTPNSTTTTPKSVLANTLLYGTRCPLNSVTLGAGKNRLRDCLCEENYFLNESGFCVACAYGYRKEEIGNFNCSCYVFDTCDPPVCNGDGSSCRPLLVTSEEEGGEFGLSEVLVDDFDDTSLTDTFDLDVEVAKQGFEFTSDGSKLISSTSIVKSEVVNGTKLTSVTNVIMRQNRLTNEVEIKILPIQNEVIKATAVSSRDDKVLIFATEHRVVLYDENSEQIKNVSTIDENEQIVDVATLNDKEELITIAYSVGILNASSSRRRLLQDETSDFCGKVNYLKRSIKRSIPTSTYKVCDPHSVALYTSDKNKDYIVVGTPCRIVSIDLHKNSIKTLVGPGEPHEKCQESDFGSKDGNFDEIRFQDASKILVDDTGSEIFVFDDNRLRKIAMTENTVSGITTVDTFDDDEIDSITNMAISPQDGTILFAQNQEIKLTVNASDSAIDTQQTRLDNKIKRLDLVKPKESKHGLYCFSEENKQNAEVTCNPNQDDVERGLLCRNGVPCVCLNGYYLKNNKCNKCRLEDA